jgi:serine/threonine protein kinase
VFQGLPVDADFIELQRMLAGRYSLERPLGKGGMGVVYLARDIVLDRRVAIKTLAPRFAASETLRERFLREARTAARLQHPNIVPIHAVEEFGEHIVIAMGYVDGGTLTDRVNEQGRLPPEEAATVLRETALALAYAHRNGVVHRDIKPDNILLDRDSGRAMIADFGIAQMAEDTRVTATGALVGTPAYMSPEQANGSAIDGRSDLYSLGVVGFFCLTGELPFTGDNPHAVLAQHVGQPPPRIAATVNGVPSRLARAVDRCLVKDRDQRVQTGEELATEFENATIRKAGVPQSLADWVDGGKELTLSQVVGAPLLLSGLIFMISFVVNPFMSGNPKIFDDEVAFVIAFTLPPIIYLVRRQQLLRRVSRNGYGITHVREALGQVEISKAGPWWWSPLQRLLLGAVTTAVMILMAGDLWGDGIGLVSWENVPLAFLAVFSAGAVADGVYGLARHGRSLFLDSRKAFWNSPIGNGIWRLATLGLRGARRQPEFGNRDTELAVGSAANVLFESLPKAVRKRLAGVPEAIARLEAIAQRERERLEELLRLEADLAPQGRGNIEEALVERHAKAAREAKESRERAEHRLREAVSALEMFRLDLLRLHARGSDVTSITADLEQALEISRRIQSQTEAVDELA